MLTFAYQTIPYYYRNFSSLFDVSKTSAASLIFCVTLYRVADKYIYPDLKEAAEENFTSQLYSWLERQEDADVDDQEQTTPEAFNDIVKHVYDLPDAHYKHPLVGCLLKATDVVTAIQVFNSEERTPELLVKAVTEVAESGRDLFLHLTSKSGVKQYGEGTHTIRELGVMTRVECPQCKEIWSKPDAHPEHGFCAECGKRYSIFDDTQA